MDDEADTMHRDTFRRVEQAVSRFPAEFGALTHYLSVSRYLERIADHATNIAEDVIYLVQGEIVRHRNRGEFPREPQPVGATSAAH